MYMCMLPTFKGRNSDIFILHPSSSESALIGKLPALVADFYMVLSSREANRKSRKLFPFVNNVLVKIKVCPYPLVRCM